MKLILFLLGTLFISTIGYSQNVACTNKTEGPYPYYVRLITDNIPTNTYNESDFVSFLESTSDISVIELNSLKSQIDTVFSSFYFAQTESLRKTISIVLKSDTMKNYLMTFDKSFSLVETDFCLPVLIGIPETETKQVTVFPNPTNGLITVSGIDVSELIVRNGIGKLMIVKNSNSIDITNLDAGVYILRIVSNENESFSKKIVLK